MIFKIKSFTGFVRIPKPKYQAVSWSNFITKSLFVQREPWCKLYPQNEKDFYSIYLAGEH